MRGNCVLLLFFNTLKSIMLITKVNPGPHDGFMGRIYGIEPGHQGLKTESMSKGSCMLAMSDLCLPSLVHLLLVIGRHSFRDGPF